MLTLVIRMLFCPKRVVICRAYSIDKQLIVEAKTAGFAIQEMPDTRRDMGGSLEGVVYSLTFSNEHHCR